MARARLSPRAAESAKPLGSLETSVVSDLASGFAAELKVQLSVEDEVAALVEAHEGCRGLSDEDRSSLIEAITGLPFIWASSGRSIAEFIDDLVVAYVEIDGEFPERFRNNAKLILGVRALRASAKAMTLYSDYDRLLVSSRIFTDLRPVFDDDLDGPLAASLITHTLKHTVHRDGRHEDIYMVLDTEDLNRLKDAIERALAKGKTLARAVRESPNQTLGASIENYPDE